MSYLKKRIQAFGFAFSGLFAAIKREKNLQLQVIIAILVIIGGIYFHCNSIDWLMIIACIACVISLELINSAIERLCDLYSKEPDPRIKYIKDVSAAAVLVASLFAAIVGLIVFIPYVKALCS
ncbi:MAG: diacylglycerol kinase family protein [Bacteroidia bacterium]